jgi:prevent-host-death family protein
MSEEFTSISQARQNLSGLARRARSQMKRFVFTQQGEPRAVLIGYEDYRSLRAAAQIAQRPELVAGITRGLEDAKAGRTIPLETAYRRQREAAERRGGKAPKAAEVK